MVVQLSGVFGGIIFSRPLLWKNLQEEDYMEQKGPRHDKTNLLQA